MERLEDRHLLAPFTPGNLVGCRVGTGVGGLTGAAAPVFIDEFDAQAPAAFSYVQSIALPVAVSGANRRLTASGSGTAECLLTRSANGYYLVLAGYDANVGTASVASTPSATVNRVIARIDAFGNIDTSTIIPDGYSGTTISGAASLDGTAFWTSGSAGSSATGGVRYVPFGNSGPTTQLTATSTRAVAIMDGQLMASGTPPTTYVAKVGAGLPTTSGQVISNLPGLPSGGFPVQPFQFFMADLNATIPGPDTLYVADQSTSGGIRKFSLVGGTWVHNGGVVLAGQGVRGLTGRVDSGVVTIFASNTETQDNDIWKLVDNTGWNQTIAQGATTIFFSGIPNAVYRGLALVPDLPIDFGDAPDGYQTRSESGGPSHVAIGPLLGARRDPEPNGQPTSAADGDDAGEDDEDGVEFLSPLVTAAAAERTTTIVVTASAAAILDAWIDFDGNGRFDDPAERITAPGGTPLAAGMNTLSITIPAAAATGITYARFRLSTAGGLLPIGPAKDGEVEDYAVVIEAEAASGPQEIVVDMNLAGYQDGTADVIDIFLDALADELVVLINGADEAFRGRTSAISSLTIIGSSDEETLRVGHAADSSGHHVAVTESTIAGLFGVDSSPPIAFAGIEVLNLTATEGDDVLDIAINPGSNLTHVVVNGSGGTDQFYLDLNTANRQSNDVAGLAMVTLIGGSGNDTFGQTPVNAPPPPPPAPLAAPQFAAPSFPGTSRGMIEPSTTTAIVIQGGLPGGPAAPGNAPGDKLNLDLTPSSLNPNSVAVVGTGDGLAITSGFRDVLLGGLEAVHVADQGRLTHVQMGDLYVRGTEAADTIQFSLTSTPNVLRTRVNSQYFNLLAWRTVVYGRGGNDNIQQTNVPLPAQFFGEGGDDYLVGYHGDDLMVGGLGNDRIFGGNGGNELWGDNLGEQELPVGGPDQIYGGSGIDVAYGGGGNDIFSLAAGDDFAFGGPGDDGIVGGPGNDRLYGGPGNDAIRGDDGHDILAGNDGDDRLYGGLGNDVLFGGRGADLLYGDDGSDLLIGGSVRVGLLPTADAASAAGDARDQALAALLADWALDAIVNTIAIAAEHDDSIDTLSGGAGIDTAAPASGDSGDWELLL